MSVLIFPSSPAFAVWPALSGKCLAAAAALVAAITVHFAPTAHAHPSQLIVVGDTAGSSALPYYENLNLQPQPRGDVARAIAAPAPRVGGSSEAEMLPVHSAKLTPGFVARRVIEAPGLRPFVVVGDDEASHAWLQRHAASLRERGAVGLVVNVETAQALARLRALAPGVPLAPVAADDLSDRLGLRHYPALITSTGIEQ
ncbi:integrating conjugative element protein [Pseudomonas veronii]|uniref:integrating conjugative element protein n=1 Tax=Pseudomonas veronii TaxID=76761 RepID=UPI0009E296EB|nr:integrating conjugative element protein [Pseudomonas veronii]